MTANRADEEETAPTVKRVVVVGNDCQGSITHVFCGDAVVVHTFAWLGSVVASGVVGNVAYDYLKSCLSLFRRRLMAGRTSPVVLDQLMAIETPQTLGAE